MIEKIENLRKKYDNLREEYIRRITRKEQFEKELIKCEDKLAELKDFINLYEKTKILLQLAAKVSRQQITEKFSTIVTEALQSIMQENLKFNVTIDTKRNIPVASFTVSTERGSTKVESDPLDAKGGGIVDIISLSLCIVILELFKIKGPLLMDESLKHLSKGYINNASQFLKEVCILTNRQVIAVTHQDGLTEAADKVHYIKLENGKTKVIEEK